MPSEKKRLVLLLDGTWNNVEDNTNVWRLCQLLAQRSDDGLTQLPYYSAGVGTTEGQKLRGGAFGYGLDDAVIAAYRWLMGHYDQRDDPDAHDEVFVFGFSRGAFTARSLTGMIARCGLLRPGAPLSVEELFERYRLDKDAPSLVELYERKRAGLPLTPDEERLLRHTRRIRIKMIGVWDTVGALGVPFGNIPGISKRRMGFHNTRLSTLFEHAYHALAIDEHRAAFAPTLWTRFTPTQPDPPGTHHASQKEVEQRWFVGAHANVGGGIAGDDLSQLPLAWLMEKAGALGLAFRDDLALIGDEQMGEVTDSFALFMGGLYRLFRLFRRYYRPIGAPAWPATGGSVAPVNETIDASVFARWRADAKYRPPNLADWVRVRGCDPNTLTGTVDATTGLPVPAPAAVPPPAAPRARRRKPPGT
jgi:uncharacterized protein (DUF2235 family)